MSNPVKVTVSGTEGVARRFRVLADNTVNVAPAWPSVGAYLSRTMRQQFTSEGRRLGTPWRPLKPEYKLWKMRNGFSRKILVRTGKLRNEFIRRPMDVERYGPSEATFGSNSQVAVWMQYGTRKNGRRIVPPRKILVVTPEVRREVKRILLNRIMEKH